MPLEGDEETEQAGAGETPEERMKEPEEEGQRPRVRKSQPMPSKREVEEHMATHIPFRNWCAHCVRGKSKSDPTARLCGTTKRPQK